jgi:hypothetical protein
MSNSPYNCFTSSFVLLQFPATHIGPNFFQHLPFPNSQIFLTICRSTPCF